MDNDPSVILTELARGGDLHSLLNKVGRLIFRERFRDQDRIRMGRRNVRNRYLMEDDQQKIPGAIIWQIFDCCEFEPLSCLLSYNFLSRPLLSLAPVPSCLDAIGFLSVKLTITF